MPKLTQEIDTTRFDDMRGRPPAMSQQIDILERKGIDGTGARRHGTRSRQGKIITHKFHTDFVSARVALQAYLLFVGANPVKITQHGVSQGYYLIESVIEKELRAAETVIGSIVANPKAYQICEWTIWQTGT